MAYAPNDQKPIVTPGHRTENDALIEALSKLQGTEQLIVKHGEREAMVMVGPPGRQIVPVKQFLDQYLPNPERRQGTARLTSLESFIEHVNRFKDQDSALFATIDDPSIQCVFDYHRATAAGLPRFGEHRSGYTFPLSDEWRAWLDAASDESLSQEEFAMLLEERIFDVLDPDAAGPRALELAETLGIKLASPQRLLEVSRGFSVRAGLSVLQAQTVSSGETIMKFEERHESADGGPLSVPGGFVIGIPVFKLGAPYQLPVRLRYRLRDRKVTWSIDVRRAELVKQDAINEACELVRDETELPLFYGRPEQ